MEKCEEEPPADSNKRHTAQSSRRYKKEKSLVSRSHKMVQSEPALFGTRECW